MPLPVTSIEGRAVDDPELRFAPSGTAVGKVRLVASSRKKNDATGKWEDDKTLWINVTCFGRVAENVAESIAKGDLVMATGRLQTDEWTNRDGEKRSQTVLIADTIGASLAFRTIKHGEGKTSRSSGRESEDPWANARPADDDEPPF